MAIPVIMVTHNDAIKNMADRVVQLRDGMIRTNYGQSSKDSGCGTGMVRRYLDERIHLNKRLATGIEKRDWKIHCFIHLPCRDDFHCIGVYGGGFEYVKGIR